MLDLTGKEIKKTGIITPDSAHQSGVSADYRKVLAANKFAMRALEINLAYLHKDITPEGRAACNLTREALKVLKGVQS